MRDQADLHYRCEKVKLTLSQAMKTQRGSTGIAPLILNLGAEWGVWPTPRPSTHCTGGWEGAWVGPEKRK